MSEVLGVECALSIAGTTLAAMLTGTSPGFNLATREILSSGPTVAGLDQALLGYAPSSGARSGFTTQSQLPYSGAATLINAILAGAGVAVALGFGAAGGISIASCICESLEVAGQGEGTDLDLRCAFQSIHTPTVGGSVSPVAKDFWKFNDVTSFTGPGGLHSIVSAFSWRVQRNLSRKVANNAIGIPFKLKISKTTCLLDATYLKEDDSEVTVQSTIPIVTADSIILLGQQPLYGSGSNALTLTCKAAFADTSPSPAGGFEDFVDERISLKSTTGGYTAA